MSKTNPKVDAYLAKSEAWQKELEKLRSIVLACKLTEELKWNKPVYTFDNSSVVSIARLKDHCWLMFFKGVLLQDPEGILAKPGDNSRSMRVIPFTSVRQITKLKSTLKAYILEAIAVEKAGLKVDFKKDDLVFPEEFIDKMDEVPELKDAFDALTPGRQRGYNLYFSGAKQSKTRASRIEKCVDRILAGKGLRDP